MFKRNTSLLAQTSTWKERMMLKVIASSIQPFVDESVREAAWRVFSELGYEKNLVLTLEDILEKGIAYLDASILPGGRPSCGVLRFTRPVYEDWDDLADLLMELGFFRRVGESLYQMEVARGNLAVEVRPSIGELGHLAGLVGLLCEVYEQRNAKLSPASLVPLKELVPVDEVDVETNDGGSLTKLSAERDMFGLSAESWEKHFSVAVILALWELSGLNLYEFQISAIKSKTLCFPYLLGQRAETSYERSTEFVLESKTQLQRARITDILDKHRRHISNSPGYWGLRESGREYACATLKNIGLVTEAGVDVADAARLYFFLFDPMRTNDVKCVLAELGNGQFYADTVRRELVAQGYRDGWPWPEVSPRYYDWYLSRLASFLPDLEVSCGHYGLTYHLVP